MDSLSKLSVPEVYLSRTSTGTPKVSTPRSRVSERFRYEDLHPAYNNIDLSEEGTKNKRGARILSVPGVSDFLTWLALREIGKEVRQPISKVKPLKTKENILKMFEKDSNLRNNIRIAFPFLKDYPYWTRITEKKELHELTELLTTKKVSNLTLARYITRSLIPTFFQRATAATMSLHPTVFSEENIDPNVNYTLRNINDMQFKRIKDDLVSKDLIHEDITKEELKDLMIKYYEPTSWGVPSSAPDPVRLSMRRLFSIDQVFLLVAVEDIKIKVEKNEIFDVSQFRNGVLAQLKLSIEKAERKSDEILAFAQTLNFDYLFKNPIPYENIFENKPTHIANSQNGPYLHHAIALTKDIVLEQFAQLPPKENIEKSFSTYVNLKYMYDYLKASRNVKGNVYVIPYKHNYSDEILRRRSLWTLGKYSFYNFKTENCESIPSWVFENNTAEPSICRAPWLGDVPMSESSGIKRFWRAILDKTGYSILFPAAGGQRKTRKYRVSSQNRKTAKYSS